MLHIILIFQMIYACDYIYNYSIINIEFQSFKDNNFSLINDTFESDTTRIYLSYITITENEYWEHNDPLIFLDQLKNSNGIRNFVISEYPPRDWIKRKHIPLLMKKINSKEKAANVSRITMDAIIPDSFSTVGNQTLFLIDGYRKKRYPPCQIFQWCYLSTDEIRNWYHRNF